jgi:hypothetical protein
MDNEELHNSYYSPNITMIKSKKIRQTGHVARVGEEGNSCKDFVTKIVGRTRRRCAVIKIHICLRTVTGGVLL